MLESESKNFTSFWDHYDLVQKWVKSSKITRQNTLNNFEWKASNNNINPLLHLSFASTLTSNATSFYEDDQIQEEIASVKLRDNTEEDKEEELSPEMIEFYRTTIEHREERNLIFL